MLYKVTLFDVGPDGWGFVKLPSGAVYPVDTYKKYNTGDSCVVTQTDNPKQVKIVN